MKLKSGFILHSIGGEHVVVAVEERTKDFRGMIRLNGTGAFLWERLAAGNSEADMCSALLEKYDIDEETAEKAVDSFLAQLSEAGVTEP